eukprot:3610882-Pyramimonas_sp.AAC.1
MRGSMCIPCDPAASAPLNAHVPCWEKHPGLCRSRDAVVYQQSLCLAKDMHKELLRVELGSFVGFMTYQFSMSYAIGCRRKLLPALLVFAECAFGSVQLPDGSDGHTLGLRDVRGEFVFETSYGLAVWGGGSGRR